ncbi:MAG: futalosine hydrolase, partial [Desulfobacteraceae bacterium]|nr:futalosine hydrolase [Desulfobacteraceae bacterium]
SGVLVTTWPCRPFITICHCDVMKGRVLILCATRLEMAVFLDRNQVSPAGKTAGNIQVFSSLDHAWDLVISGPGVFNAACALTACLERFQPAYILHTGIAGMFDSFGLNPGDAAVAVTETYIHTGVDRGRAGGTDRTVDKDPKTLQSRLDHPASNHPKGHGGKADPLSCPAPLPGASGFQIPLEPLPFDLVAGQAMTRQGVYALDPDLAVSCTDLLARSLGCRVIQGPFITVSSITGSFEKAAALSKAFSPVMESMEGAAVAHVAALYQVPMVEIRAASNRVGERDKTRWDMKGAVQTVADICEAIAFPSVSKE